MVVFGRCCWMSVMLLSALCGLCAEVRALTSGEDLLAAVAEDCITGDESVMTCLRHKVLSYVDHLSGVEKDFQGRSMSDDMMDEVIARRLKKYLDTHQFKIQLPRFLFEEATLTFSPGRGLADFKVDFPEEEEEEEEEKEREMSEGRGHLKKKLLLPLLLLLKLKIKALTPILLVIVGIKAVKAFIMSKLSLLLVIGFVVLQLFKKGGMSMPMAMPAAVVTDPPPVYGPPPTSATYGPPAPTPETSYGPWDPNNNSNSGNGNNVASSYARWDSHGLAYNAHQPDSAVKTAQQLQQGAK